ncbi:hypothetical protein ACX0L9_003854, partial [Shigella flexneri]
LIYLRQNGAMRSPEIRLLAMVTTGNGNCCFCFVSFKNPGPSIRGFCLLTPTANRIHHQRHRHRNSYRGECLRPGH